MEIGLRSNNDTGNVGNAAKIDNLVIHNLDHVERVPRGNRVDKDESVDAYSMF